LAQSREHTIRGHAAIVTAARSSVVGHLAAFGALRGWRQEDATRVVRRVSRAADRHGARGDPRPPPPVGC
jgi:hypothetical protein